MDHVLAFCVAFWKNECGCLAGDVAAVDAVFTLRLVDCWLYSMVFFFVSDDVLVGKVKTLIVTEVQLGF